MTYEPTDEMVEKVARAVCAADPDIRMGDAEGVVQQRVNREWPRYADHARAAIAATAPLILEQAVEAGRNAWPRAHTYASENADLYRGQDHAVSRVLAAIRRLGET